MNSGSTTCAVVRAPCPEAPGTVAPDGTITLLSARKMLEHMGLKLLCSLCWNMALKLLCSLCWSIWPSNCCAACAGAYGPQTAVQPVLEHMALKLLCSLCWSIWPSNCCATCAGAYGPQTAVQPVLEHMALKLLCSLCWSIWPSNCCAACAGAYGPQTAVQPVLEHMTLKLLCSLCWSIWPSNCCAACTGAYGPQTVVQPVLEHMALKVLCSLCWSIWPSNCCAACAGAYGPQTAVQPVLELVLLPFPILAPPHHTGSQPQHTRNHGDSCTELHRCWHGQLVAVQQCHVHKVEENLLPVPPGRPLRRYMVDPMITEIYSAHVLVVIDDAVRLAFHKPCFSADVGYTSRCIRAQHQHRFPLRPLLTECDGQHVFSAVRKKL